MTDVRTTAPFPKRPDDVTATWLTEQLRASGRIGAEHTVSGFTASPIGEGVGMLGVIVRLELQYQGEPGPLPSLVAKFATPTEAIRAVAMTFRMYEREVRFFRELADRVTEGIPGHYAAEIDLDTGDFVLLLEDLADYRPGDQAAGCGLHDAEVGIDAMARLHAAWWGAEQRPELSWVPTVDGDLHRQGMVAGTKAGWEPFVAGFGHLVAPEIIANGARYMEAAEGLHHRMGQGHQTLLHGDFRLDNLLFGVEPDHDPIALVDWQGLIVSKGPHDLAYLLSQNLRTELRRQHERELVGRYHQRLMDAGITDYTLEECWEDYRLASLWLFEYAVVIGGTLDPANERGTAFMARLIERSSATIMDLDLLDLLP